MLVLIQFLIVQQHIGELHGTELREWLFKKYAMAFTLTYEPTEQRENSATLLVAINKHQANAHQFLNNFKEQLASDNVYIPLIFNHQVA